MATLTYKQVVEYFDSISGDMAELVIGIIQDKLAAKAEKRAKISANLKKARAARGSKQVEAAESTAAPARRPGRPARVESVEAAVVLDQRDGRMVSHPEVSHRLTARL